LQVVVVVAVAVLFVVGRTAVNFLLHRCHVIRVQAFALRAVELLGVRTAIAVIPVASELVVIVIAIAITLVVFAATIGLFRRHVVGIQAFARGAVSRSNVWSTAIAAIPVAGLQVVVVVAVAVLFVVGRTAVNFLLHRCHVIRVQAFALRAVELLGVRTAIAVIPVASELVVIVIAIAITLVVFAATIGLFRRHVVGIQAFARDTVLLSNVWSTAIAAVEFARSHVVLIVTVAITLVGLAATIGFLSRFLRWWHVTWVQAFAIEAEILSDIWPTTIAAIPAASGLVVFVVTVAVALVLLIKAVRCLGSRRRFCWRSFVVRIFAFAFFTVFSSSGWSTTISAIVITTRIVVVVVTLTVTFVCLFSACWRWCRFRDVRAVLAFTALSVLFAVLISSFVQTATISTVPIAAGVVVVGVTETVVVVALGSAESPDLGNAFIRFPRVSAVAAFAVCARFVLFSPFC